MLNVPVFADFMGGGAMLKAEYGLAVLFWRCCIWGCEGVKAEKFERPLDIVLLVVELPQPDVDDVFALLQSIPALGAVYEGVVIG